MEEEEDHDGVWLSSSSSSALPLSGAALVSGGALPFGVFGCRPSSSCSSSSPFLFLFLLSSLRSKPNRFSARLPSSRGPLQIFSLVLRRLSLLLERKRASNQAHNTSPNEFKSLSCKLELIYIVGLLKAAEFRYD